MLSGFEKGVLLGAYASPKAGLATGDNNMFQRHWSEVCFDKIGLGYHSVDETINTRHKWYPCNSGGEFRKWAINNELVVDWQNNGSRIRQFRNAAGKLAARPQNTAFYFKEGITWNKISRERFAVKYKPKGSIFDDTSRSAFIDEIEDIPYLVGFLCSSVCFNYLKALNPTMSFTNNDLERLPFIQCSKYKFMISQLVKENIGISQFDWDTFEQSRNFTKNPLLIYGKSSLLSYAFSAWSLILDKNFARLKNNEEELNRIFIEIYGLQNELSPEVEDKDITIRKADLGRDIRPLFLMPSVVCSAIQP